MDEITKEDFYSHMYRHMDSSDDEVDSFIEFRQNPTSDATDKRDAASKNHVGLQSSQIADIIMSDNRETHSSMAQLPDIYITNPGEFNQWLKLNKKKEMVVAKSSKLKGCVLLYWPPSPNSMPGKNRKASFASVIEHGGILAKGWDDGHHITHIVVDSTGKGREYKDVLEDLKLESIPQCIQLVTAGWVDDKINPRWGQNYCSEDRFRVSGHTRSSGSSQDTKLTDLTKKREMINATANDKVKKAKIQISPPSNQHIEFRAGPEKGLIIEDDVSKHSSPKLMKQRQALNFGVRLGMKALNNKVPIEADSNNIDIIMRYMQKAQDDRDIRELIQRGSIGSELTDNGNNIDRIFETTPEDVDLAYESDEPEEEVSSAKAKGFLCAKKNLKGRVETGPNAALIEQLKCLAAHYAAKKDDAFRAKGYREAISVIRKQKHKILTKEQALGLPRIGSSIATKIEEFGKHGSIELVNNFAADPREQAIGLFTGIYGVGQRTAEEWYSAGIRTLEQLKDIKLHDHQQIGLDHYEDFNSRIPRDEVTLHVECVTRIAKKINEHLEVVVGGSYRRGAVDSGDVDFLITASDAHVSSTHLRTIIFEQLIPTLKTAGYIKADLTTSDGGRESSKWMGAACLPGSETQTWRRIDILVVPNVEWGAALLYFTGNDIFNRSMRLLARRGGGSLNQRGLYKGVIRGKDGVKIVPGTLVESRDERKIFEALGVKWRPPHERCP